MNETASFQKEKRRLSTTGFISGVLVAAGLILGATVNMAFWILFILGAFGPTALRAVGWLRDLDEFQLEAARRAGHHAFLATGVFLGIVVITKQWGTANLEHDAYSASAVLSVLVTTYFMSRLVSFWGARGAAFRILLVFGGFWLTFAVLSHRGVEMFMEGLIALPFFLLAFASRHWPRASGALLLLCAGIAFLLFRLDRAFHGEQGAVVVAVAFMMPLLVTGIALLADRPEARNPGDGSEAPPTLSSSA